MEQKNTNITNIALLKPDAQIEELALKSAGFNVWSTQDPDVLYERLLVERVDILIVDLDQPQLNYFNVIQSLHNTKEFPIITISDHNNIFNQIIAISSGADRNIPKPFNIQLFLTNVLAINRSKKIVNAIKAADNNTINTWQLNTNKWSIKSPEGINLDLTMKEMMLIKILVEKNGEFIKKDELHNLIFSSFTYKRTPSLDRLLNQLRSKTAVAFEVKFPLKTVYLAGYAFTSPCKIISDI